MKDNKVKYMNLALKEAQKASVIDEVPIGCVIVKDNIVISKGHNLRETNNDVTGHAELVAIRKAAKKLNDWQLIDCDLYVTIEPCVMCMGAIIQSHIKKVYYGSEDLKAGAISKFHLLELEGHNHYPNIEGGLLKEECSKIVKEYFANKRKNK